MAKPLLMGLDPQAAVAAIRAKTKVQPIVGIVLGSGLGRLADEVADATRIPYAELPGWERSTAPGHSGELVVGTLGGKRVAVMKGRLHYYEGYDMTAVTFPVRVFKAWGIDTIILTNACGGLNPKFKAGDLMLIEDHINFMPANPLRGPNDERLGPRFPDMVGTYTEDLRAIAKTVDADLREGIYVAVAGPNFETPAELRMLRGFGADAVGMSTVPEVITAVHQGMRVLGLSIITDNCLPDALEPTSVEQIIAVARGAEPKLATLVRGVLERL